MLLLSNHRSSENWEVFMRVCLRRWVCVFVLRAPVFVSVHVCVCV